MAAVASGIARGHRIRTLRNDLGGSGRRGDGRGPAQAELLRRAWSPNRSARCPRPWSVSNPTCARAWRAACSCPRTSCCILPAQRFLIERAQAASAKLHAWQFGFDRSEKGRYASPTERSFPRLPSSTRPAPGHPLTYSGPERQEKERPSGDHRSLSRIYPSSTGGVGISEERPLLFRRFRGL